MNKKVIFSVGAFLYLLNYAGKQLEEIQRLQMENSTLKKQLNEKWDRTALN